MVASISNLVEIIICGETGDIGLLPTSMGHIDRELNYDGR